MADGLVTIGADLADLRRQIATIVPEGGKAAAKVLNDLSSAIARTESAAKAAALESAKLTAATKATAATTKTATQGWKETEQGVGRAKEGLAGFAAALNVIDPKLGAVVQQGSALTGALKAVASAGAGLAVPLGALTLAVGAAAGAYLYFKGKVDDAEEAMRKQATAATEMVGIHRQVERAALRAAIAEGRMTEAEAASITATETATDAFAGYRAGIEDKIKATRDAIAAVEKEAAGGGPLFQGFEEARPAAEQTAELTRTLGNLQTQLGIVNAAEERYAGLVSKGSTPAIKERTEAIRDAVDAEKQRAKQAADYLDWEVEQLDRKIEKEEATAAAELEMDRHVHEIKLDAMRKEAAYAEKTAADTRTAQRSAADAVLSNAQSLAAGLSGVMAEGSAAAQAFYVVSQGLEAAGAIISGHRAAAAAFEPPPVGLGPLAGAPLAGTMIGFGYAQAGLIAAETVASFGDTPGAVYMPSGGLVGTSPGDTVIAAKDPKEAARQANQAAGWGQSRPSVVVVDGYKHIAMGRGSRDAARSPGAWKDIQRQTGRSPGRL